MEGTSSIDRLAMRGRPSGLPVVHQRWEHLLFLHWAADPQQLRPLIPSALDIDLFDGKAWIGITPFHLEDVRPTMLPAFPGMSSFDELNVRTYVTHKGIPGIWFFSLDASKLMAVVAARMFFMLPYYKAEIRFRREQSQFNFELQRKGPPEASFKARWQIGQRLRDPDIDSLAFFLMERYCYFAVDSTRIYETRIYHHPWILDEAVIQEFSSSMIRSLGLAEPVADPLLHFAGTQDVEVWAPKEVGSQSADNRVRIPVE